jgi:hypothetical protein
MSHTHLDLLLLPPEHSGVIIVDNLKALATIHKVAWVDADLRDNGGTIVLE